MTHLLPQASLAALNPKSLSSLVAEFEAEAKLENPDTDLPLSALTMTEGDMIKVPDLGTFTMSEWSRSQLATMLGLRWSRWSVGADPQQRAEELNRRLARAKETVRVRSTRRKPEDASGDGMISAFVTPRYDAAPDPRIAELIAETLKGTEPQPTLLRSSSTDKTTSYVVALGAPFEPRRGTPVGALNGGLFVQNSNVGFCKLSITLMLHRLVCQNGMIVSLPGSTILSHRHRGLDFDEIRAVLTEGLKGVEDRLYRGGQLVVDAVGQEVENVEQEVEQLLRGARLPVRLVPSVMNAYGREPHPSRFGVVQALTLAAQAHPAEVRHDLEQLAGQYAAGAR